MYRHRSPGGAASRAKGQGIIVRVPGHRVRTARRHDPDVRTSRSRRCHIGITRSRRNRKTLLSRARSLPVAAGKPVGCGKETDARIDTRRPISKPAKSPTGSTQFLNHTIRTPIPALQAFPPPQRRGYPAFGVPFLPLARKKRPPGAPGAWDKIPPVFGGGPVAASHRILGGSLRRPLRQVDDLTEPQRA